MGNPTATSESHGTTLAQGTCGGTIAVCRTAAVLSCRNAVVISHSPICHKSCRAPEYFCLNQTGLLHLLQLACETGSTASAKTQ